METCSIVLTFESVEKCFDVTIQMQSAVRQHFYIVPFVF